MIALLCVALAAAAQAPGKAAAAAGIACALKATAWPAVPVIAVMLAAGCGPKSGWRFAGIAALTAAAAMLAAAPAVLLDPGATLRNAVLFPLGLTRHRTPAASPLPGHLLAAAGPAGKWAAFVLLAASALGFAGSLALRPPRTMDEAAVRLAIALGGLFTLAPATRWGYYAYPLVVAGGGSSFPPGAHLSLFFGTGGGYSLGRIFPLPCRGRPPCRPALAAPRRLAEQDRRPWPDGSRPAARAGVAPGRTTPGR